MTYSIILDLLKAICHSSRLVNMKWIQHLDTITKIKNTNFWRPSWNNIVKDLITNLSINSHNFVHKVSLSQYISHLRFLYSRDRLLSGYETVQSGTLIKYKCCPSLKSETSSSCNHQPTTLASLKGHKSAICHILYCTVLYCTDCAVLQCENWNCCYLCSAVEFQNE